MQPLLLVFRRRWLLPIAGVVFLFAVGERLLPVCRAEGEPSPVQTAPLAACDLGRMCPAELDQLFAGGRVGAPPVGAAHGRVLLVVSARNPRARAQMMSAVWKGKLFFPDGTFTNLWLCGLQAVPSCMTIAASWYDEKPCFVLEYPPGSPVFANNRDEFREIAPGLFLARLYDRCPRPQLKGYFVLELGCCP